MMGKPSLLAAAYGRIAPWGEGQEPVRLLLLRPYNKAGEPFLWGLFPRGMLFGGKGVLPARAQKGADRCLTRIDFRAAGSN